MKLSVLAAARERPDDLALVHDGVELTFTELGERVAHRVSELQRESAEVRRLALEAEHDLPTLVTAYAAIELGLPLAVLHPAWSAAEKRAVTATLSEFEDKDGDSASTGEERCLAVLFTSGTGSSPRGILLSRRAVLATAEANAANLAWHRDDRWLLSLPLAHVGGLSILTRCLVARRPMVVDSRPGAFDPKRFATILEDRRITLLSLVPTMLKLLLDALPAWRPPSTLRAVLLGGAAGSDELVARAEARGLPILTTYGLTEAGSQVATRRLTDRQVGRTGVGPPLPGTELRTVGGRIHVRAATLLSGYLGETAGVLSADGWFRTSDLGEIAEDGWLTVLGRADELIVTGGKKVHPREVEQVLETHPSIDDAVAFGVEDATWGDLVAVALGGSDLPGDDEIELFCRERLASHQRPRAVARFASLPRTGSGKVARQRAREAARSCLRALE